jgi:uncharacterized membrane protein
MRDRTHQTVLGVFVGIFASCLVVLRTIRGGDAGVFVPSVAVLVAVALAFVGIAFLIFFIDHIGSSIQASQIIAKVAKETLEAVNHLFPENRGDPADEAEGAASMAQRPFHGAIPARRPGYVQRVDVGALMDFARARQTIVRMECRVGEFVIADTPLASVSEVRDVDPDAVRQINAAVTVDRRRTVDQDAAYGIRQPVDVALKGLSPGINDTTTAIMCVDYLTAILARLAHRQLETPGRGEAGELQVIVRRPTYADFVAEGLRPDPSECRRRRGGDTTPCPLSGDSEPHYPGHRASSRAGHAGGGGQGSDPAHRAEPAGTGCSRVARGTRV